MMHTKYTYLDGVAVQYAHAGQSTLPEVVPDFSHGRAVLLLHGEGGNGNLWHHQAAALAAAHSPVHFDFPGHGRSGGTESLKSIDAYADCTLRMLDALALPRAVLVGHSMGAAAALTVAARHPDRVAGLVLCAAAARFEFPAPLLEAWRDVMRGRAAQPFTMEGFSPRADTAAVRATFMENIKTDPRVRYFDMLACQRFDGEALVARVRTPTLAIAAADDQLVPVAEVERLQRAIVGARLAVIADAGHSLLLEQPDALSAVLLDFLGTLP